MRGSTIYTAAVAATAALVLAGCGSSDSSSGYGGGGGSSSTGSTTSGGAYGSSSTGANGSTNAAATTAVGTKSGSLGTYLVDTKGRTLYLWEADTKGRSTCSGSCAVAWPPLLAKGTPKAKGKTKASLLSTTKRTGGAKQVVYAGHPLYRYAGDTVVGQTNGQGSNGFGALWYVVAPSGKAITKP